MARGPAATTRLQADSGAEPKLRYLDRIARRTSRIPEKGAQLDHYYGACSNAHAGFAARRPSSRNFQLHVVSICLPNSPIIERNTGERRRLNETG